MRNSPCDGCDTAFRWEGIPFRTRSSGALTRGWENFVSGYRKVFDEWSGYDARHVPVRLLETGDNRPPDKLMEDATEHQTPVPPPRQVKPLDDPDFIGAEAAFQRAAAKVIAQAKAAGLEPVVAVPEETRPRIL